SVGNSVTNGGAGLGVRRLFGTNFSSGQVYFSALFRMNDPGYGSNGWNGLTTPVGLFTAPDNTSFRLQVMVKSSSPSDYHPGDTVLLVGRYDFTVLPNVVTLWLNPAPSTLGEPQPPTSGYVAASSGTDGSTSAHTTDRV